MRMENLLWSIQTVGMTMMVKSKTLFLNNYVKTHFSFIGEISTKVILDNLPEWYSLGTRIFGGCCMVSPEDIQKIANICRKFH